MSTTGDDSGGWSSSTRRPLELEEYAEAAERRKRPTQPGTPKAHRRGWLLFAAVVAGLAMGAALVGLGYGLQRTRDSAPSQGSPEAGFARDMQTQLAQAVEMSLIIRDKSTDPELRAVAYDIVTRRQHQIGQMYAWLNQWRLPQAPTDPPTAWMQHDGDGTGISDGDGMIGMHGPAGAAGDPGNGRSAQGVQMPGMASLEDVARLAELNGTAAEILWLELMIDHHLGGIEMARVVLAQTDRPEVVQLATAIARSQEVEIDAMQIMLEERTNPAAGSSTSPETRPVPEP